MREVVLVLAAGASQRMGRPKALLELGGVSLVTRAVRCVREAGAEPLVVVGAEAEAVIRQLDGASYVINTAWEAGMGGSVALGARSMAPDVTRLGVWAVDQPWVDAAALSRLFGACAGPWSAAACVYEGGALGIPAVFGASMFGALRGLSGPSGAKALLNSASWTVAKVQGVRVQDVDTPEAWRACVEAWDAQD